MRKTKKSCHEAADAFIRQARRLYPSAKFEVFSEAYGGFDIEVHTYVAKRSIVPASRKFAHISNEIDDDYGVSILVSTGALEDQAAA